MLDRLIKTAANRSKNQMKTLVQTILPRIALYKGAAGRAASGGNIYAHADVHDGLGGSRKARFHGENGVCAGILSDLQLLFSQNHAYLRLVGEHTGTRQNALFRVDYRVSGTRRARKTAVRSCVRCFATWMT